MSSSAYYSGGMSSTSSSSPASPTLDLDVLVDDEELAQLLVDSDDAVHALTIDDVTELDQIARAVLDQQSTPSDEVQVWGDERISPQRSLHALKYDALDEGEKFDWASVAAIAILGPASSSSSSTAPSSQTSSPQPSPFLRSLQVEDKVEPHSPTALALPAVIPSSTPSALAPVLAPSLSLTSSTSLHRLSSSLSARIVALCSSISACASSTLCTQELLESVIALRQLLSTRSPTPFSIALSTDVLPAFVSILHWPTAPAQLTLEVAWCLTNLASGSSEHVTQLVEAGVVDGLMAHVGVGQQEQVSEQVVWTLGNIAGDSWQFRDLLLDKGLMQRICALSEEDHVSRELLKHLCWTIHNLCRNKPSPAASKVAVCIPAIRRLLLGGGPGGTGAPASADSELLPDLLWTLSCLSEASDQLRSRLLAEGFLEYLMDSLQQLDSLPLLRLTPTIRTVGNFLTGTESETQIVLDHGFVPLLLRLLRYPMEQVRKEACWAASNVAAGSKEQKKQLFDEPGLLDEIIHLSATAKGSVKKEATWVLCNLCEGGVVEQMDVLIAKGVLAVLTQGLLHPSEHIYPVAAAGLQCILRRDDRYKDTQQCRDVEAIIRKELTDRLRGQRTQQQQEEDAQQDDLPALNDEVLAPLTYDEDAEQAWSDLVDGAPGDELDRLTMMRNVLTMIRHRQEDEDEEGEFSRGEERRKDEEEEEEEDGRVTSSSTSAASPLFG